MKKSDMIKELCGIIEINSLIVEEYISKHAMEVIAKAMLSHVETRGMLPPTIEKKQIQKVVRCFGEPGKGNEVEVPGTFEYVAHINEWEDDEEDWG